MNRAEAGHLLIGYFRGELSPVERRRLVDAVLSDQDLYNAFAEELILDDMLCTPGFDAKVKAALQPVPTGAITRPTSFRSPNESWRLTAAIAAVVLLSVGGVIVYRTRQPQMAIFAPSGSSRISPADHSRNEPGLASSEMTTPRPPRAAEPARHSTAPTLLSLLLLPDQRDSGLSTNVVSIRGERTVRLLIDIANDRMFPYRATLESADLQFAHTFSGLTPYRSRTGSRQIALEFPASLLHVGDYSVTVFRSTTGGPEQPIGGYSFSVKQATGGK